MGDYGHAKCMCMWSSADGDRSQLHDDSTRWNEVALGEWQCEIDGSIRQCHIPQHAYIGRRLRYTFRSNFTAHRLDIVLGIAGDYIVNPVIFLFSPLTMANPWNEVIGVKPLTN